MATLDVPDGLMFWWAHGERGISSNAIVERLSGMPAGRDWGHDWPLDPSDFYRCVKLLEFVSEFRERLPEMAGRSPTWAALVARWDEIEKLFMQEKGDDERNWTAPKTYALMETIMDEVKT